MNAARTGRKPSGPQIVERLEGSPSAKQRLEVILETIAGQLTIPEACAQLSICESRFHDLRNETLQATLNALEPRRQSAERTCGRAPPSPGSGKSRGRPQVAESAASEWGHRHRPRARRLAEPSPQDRPFPQ